MFASSVLPLPAWLVIVSRLAVEVHLRVDRTSAVGRHLPAGVPKRVGCYGSACRRSAGIGWPAAVDPKLPVDGEQRLASRPSSRVECQVAP